MDQVDDFLGRLPEHRAAIMKRILDTWPDVICNRVTKAANTAVEYKRHGKRVLIFVLDDNHAKFSNDAMLKKKLDSHYVTGFDSFTDLQAAVSKFNDPNQAADVFISTFKDVEQGLIFHGACNHGIVFEYPSNLGTLRKAIQTLRYSGQMKRDHWINFHQVGTMDELKAQGMYIRAAKHILSNKDYCSYFDDNHRAIRAYYDLAVSMGDSSSRYPRNRVLLDKLETEQVRREGLFYYAVGKWLAANPGTADMFKTDTMARIAKSWKPATDLTMKHIRLSLPEIPNGIVLYNYVDSWCKTHRL
ncbi:hypothetical protein BKA59DRAFT_507189 [Fusarium tricinctum]|uniref:Uncharacterized protein n=1 Tax=Fusarium tricinctum TaxID=61284 RepID=A0A8K0S3Z1_9HYPO|nr:hypothetical protein BKA59DRAFT_507189 [Fusarium tricinctum]